MVSGSIDHANLLGTGLPDAAPRVEAVEAIVGFEFRDRSLLLQALLHRSAVLERQRDGGILPGLPSNERLEFLGDAILSMLVARLAFESFPSFDEGRLTEVRAALVRRSTLALVADSIGLGSNMYVGRSERKVGTRGRMTVLAEGLEALVAAIFLDRGIDETWRFVSRLFADRVPELLERAGTLNAKSRLQEFAQAQLKVIPTYVLLDSSGPAHDTRFTIQVTAGPFHAAGHGTSKQNAEQVAARALLAELTGATDQELTGRVELRACAPTGEDRD